MIWRQLHGAFTESNFGHRAKNDVFRKMISVLKKNVNSLKIKDFIIIISVGNASCNSKSRNQMNYLYLFKNPFGIKQNNSVTLRKTRKSDENIKCYEKN